ncbi:hypothetical protein EYW49_19055 [Siculibacillus lacustris]|uniref:Uncharacterized protein n=1 Tax=Siculibacillus lacustris TaxID=1549641 RepID=A0A4Q9VH99_9HYPH|nr:hypothetical protein [Siculibacillus lacustris]TBW33956.1 hypothetical protein EYW49_19055 [Siculibacillus lacustris]
MNRKSNSSSRVAAAVAVGVLLLAVAGCGRKADPEVPVVGAAPAASVRPIGIPMGPTPVAPAPKPPSRPFVLDPIL